MGHAQINAFLSVVSKLKKKLFFSEKSRIYKWYVFKVAQYTLWLIIVQIKPRFVATSHLKVSAKLSAVADIGLSIFNALIV